MTAAEGALQADFAQEAPRLQRIGRATWLFVRRYPIGAFSAAYIAVIVVLAAVGPWVAPHDYYRSIAISHPGAIGAALVRYRRGGP